MNNVYHAFFVLILMLGTLLAGSTSAQDFATKLDRGFDRAIRSPAHTPPGSPR